MTSFEFFEAVTSAGADARESRLIVQHTHEHSSWAALPPSLCSRLFESRAALPLALELRPLQHRAGVTVPAEAPCYVAWAGAACAAGCVGVPGSLARALGLGQGTTVAVRALPQAPAAVSVTVEPVSEDDWEIVELNAEYLEQQLLNQVGVASLHQPLPFWIRSMSVTLRVTAAVPADAAVLRLVRGSEIYVAPRLRVRPSEAAVAAAAVGNLLAPHQQHHGDAGDSSKGRAAASSLANGSIGTAAAQEKKEAEGSSDEAAAPPLQTVLRVQQLSSRAASILHASSSVAPASSSAESAVPSARAQHQQQPAEPPEVLPPRVQRVFVCPATLARCGLTAGDWVRLAGRTTRSLTKFASLVPSELAAPGHLALTPGQCEWVGAPPFSHIRLQRLTASQQELILEAAELQRSNGGSRTSGSTRPTAAGLMGRAAAGAALQGEQVTDGSLVGQQQSSCDGGATVDAAAAALTASGWLRPAAEAALARLLPVLGFTPRSLLQSWGAPRPGGLLVAGPAGSGKSALLAAAAAALQAHPECLTFNVVVSCRQVSAEGASQAQAQILPKVQEALDHMPAMLVFDDLDVLCPAESAGADGAASSADPALLSWLCDLIDYLGTPSLDWGRLPACFEVFEGTSSSRKDSGVSVAGSWRGGGGPPPLGSALWPPLAVAATCCDAAALAAPLRAAGRLDHVVFLPPPTADSRAAILAAAAAARGAHIEPRHIRQLAQRADGFDAADLEVLLDRALHVAVRRQLAGSGSMISSSNGGSSRSDVSQKPSTPKRSSGSSGGVAPLQQAISIDRGSSGSDAPGQPTLPRPALHLSESDLSAALEGFTPAAFWGTGSRRAVQAGVEGWADVGGMEEARQVLHEALELPTKYARLIVKAPLRLRTGVLLYGPPGCGKTHIVAAAVAAAGVRCITVSGPELLNKYIGASEAAVRDVFQRAAAAAPSVLFFDEFDAIAPQRGHDNTGVTDRVVNQLLTELDGVEGLRGVCVVCASSRPDLIDAALLRPGRLDRLVYCGFPSPTERGQVLQALARGVAMAPDADLGLVGYNAEFFSGADLAALLAEAQLAAVHEALEWAATLAQQAPHEHAAAPPTIQRRHLEVALGSARPSVPEAERERLESIYARFKQDREPGGAARAVDKGKGKLVSWA